MTHRTRLWTSRRGFLGQVVVSGAGAWLAVQGRAEDTVTLPFDNGDRPLIAYPQKRPLIRHTTRPPQLETPFAVFNDGLITPNDAFFVRYHLAPVPTMDQLTNFRLNVKGLVKDPLIFTLDELKQQFEAVELVAVNQCSGNSRGFSSPRVPGGQAGHGNMGNARWKGARLKDILAKAGVGEGARQVAFDGLDKGLLPTIPDFTKALDVDHALDGEVMVAWEMNGEPLPWLNGYPLRLVVPGYYGTYWIKHLSEINVLDKVFDGYWMSTAYRIPANACGCVEPGTTPKSTVPISRFNVRSFVTSVAEGDRIPAYRELRLRGIAFDGGYGIREVLYSVDGGKTWRAAQLGEDLGKYSFREWTAGVTLPAGSHELKARATNRIGQSQPLEALWNPPGYLRNVVETVRVTAA